MLNRKLLEILACSICKGALHYDNKKNELICVSGALAFPVKDEIPIMLRESAREISVSEREEYQ